MTQRLIAVFSDVHGNDRALARCLEDARAEAYRLDLPLQFWFLGDIGNGLPGTDQCLRMLDDLGVELREWLIGNHDLAQLIWWPQHDAAPLDPASEEQRIDVRQAALQFIREENEIELLRDDVGALELVQVERPKLWERWSVAPAWIRSRDLPQVFMAHGLIVEEDHYHPANTTTGLLDRKVIEQLERMRRILDEIATGDAQLVLTGHTHLATVWLHRTDGEWQQLEVGTSATASYQLGDSWYPLPSDQLWVLNVGSVGWQRDGALRPDAAETVIYLLLRVEDDQLSVSFRCLRYELEDALAHYVNKGAPEWLISRVRKGL